MNILGISCYYHDSAACLVCDGDIVAAAQEERFTRKKHDADFPRNAIKYCLSEKNLSSKNIDYIAFYDKPFIKFERILQTYLAYAPQGIASFLKAVPLWIKQKVWIKELIRKELDFSGTILFPEHHESHAASAFFPSPFQEAAFLTMDGVGEWTTTSYGIGRDNHVEIHAEIPFPHSLGLLYSAFTYYLGFRVNSGEYKVMGLAPYGEPVYIEKMRELVDIKEDGSIHLNMRYFDYCAGLRMVNSRFERLFNGAARRPETRLEQRHMDIARSLQAVTEEAVLKASRHIHKETGMKNLCLAGGVALNCVANGRVLHEGPFENVWIQPAAGDAGGALGAALLAWYQYLGNPRIADGKKDSQKASLLGPAFSDETIKQWLDTEKIPYEEIRREDIPERAAALIASEKVVGWLQGRMEFGPRALGARSILGDARSPKMQEVMNLKIKFRESFRPFAPSVLKEKAREYFDSDAESPYMLLTAQVAASHHTTLTEDSQKLKGLEKLYQIRSDIPAVTHVDYSARLQTVARQYHEPFYELLKVMDGKYGCPVIINTSFNVRGEPIVCTPQDAYQCFMRTNMDFLIAGSYIIDKTKQPKVDLPQIPEGAELD